MTNEPRTLTATTCGPECPEGLHAHPVTLEDELAALLTADPR